MKMRGLLALPLAALVAACVHTPAPAYQPGIESLRILRAAPGQPLAVGEFDAGPKVDDQRLGGLRGSSMSGGDDGRFSRYLQQALEAELKQAGRLDPGAGQVLTGTLLRNQLSANSGSTGYANLSARFVLRRDGEIVFDKQISAREEWESSFIGAIAIPAGMQGYAATVQKLVATLFADPDFQAATR